MILGQDYFFFNVGVVFFYDAITPAVYKKILLVNSKIIVSLKCLFRPKLRSEEDGEPQGQILRQVPAEIPRWILKTELLS